MKQDVWVHVSEDQIVEEIGQSLSLGGVLKGVSVGADQLVHGVGDPRPTYRLTGSVLTRVFGMLICDAGPYGVLPVCVQRQREDHPHTLDLTVMFRLLWPHEQVAVESWVPQLDARIDALAILSRDGLRRVESLSSDGWFQMRIDDAG